MPFPIHNLFAMCMAVVMAYGAMFAITARADINPFIEEGLNRYPPPAGILLDVQSADRRFYNERLDYIEQQVEQVYNHSASVPIVLLSRGRELRQLLKSELRTDAYRRLKFLAEQRNVKIVVDVQASLAQGYNEDSFPAFVTVNAGAFTDHANINRDWLTVSLATMKRSEAERLRIRSMWHQVQFNKGQ